MQGNILISACLLGNPVRYNGTDLLLDHPLIKKWQQQERLISICPEVSGGMSVPRAPAEIVNENEGGSGELVLQNKAKVIDKNKQDVTAAFVLGAQQALKIAQENRCVAAVLTERSPSCGSSLIYDGSFSGSRIEGVGVTSALLKQNGIKVFNQYQLEQAQIYLDDLSGIAKSSNGTPPTF